MNYASYQAAEVPEGGTSNAVPDGVKLEPRVVAQPGALSVSADGTTTSKAVQGLNTADMIGSGQTGILGTARTATGSPKLGSAIQPTDIITVKGMELTVATAEQLGILSRDPLGAYREVQGGVEAAQKEPEQAPVVDDAVALADPRQEADFADLCQNVSPYVQVSALHQLVTEGTVNAQTLTHAATEAGTEPGVVKARIDAITAGFEAQAVSAVKGWGSDDPHQFFDWARDNKPREFQKAMHAHGMERNTKGYEPLYREFVSTIADRDPEAILNAQFGSGLSAKRVDGQIILTLPGGGEMSFKAALKSGLISVKGA